MTVQLKVFLIYATTCFVLGAIATTAIYYAAYLSFWLTNQIMLFWSWLDIFAWWVKPMFGLTVIFTAISMLFLVLKNSPSTRPN